MFKTESYGLAKNWSGNIFELFIGSRGVADFRVNFWDFVPFTFVQSYRPIREQEWILARSVAKFWANKFFDEILNFSNSLNSTEILVFISAEIFKFEKFRSRWWVIKIPISVMTSLFNHMIIFCSSHVTALWSGTFVKPICTFRISRIQLNDPIAPRDLYHMTQIVVKLRSHDWNDHLDSSECGQGRTTEGCIS